MCRAHFLFPDPAPAEIYTLSLHDALPISGVHDVPERPLLHVHERLLPPDDARHRPAPQGDLDRKSTRLNSSHVSISYAVFCLKKKKSPTGRATASARRATTGP